MQRIIFTTLSFAFVAIFGATANLDAAPHHATGHVATHAPVAVHAHAPVVVHNHPAHIPFHVRGYHGWASRCWFPGFGCYGYYCGQEQVWYYWYAPLNEYLPISYMSIYPPTPAGAAPVNVVSAMPGSPALPPGATLVPGPITAP